jgi:hypothetical protein
MNSKKIAYVFGPMSGVPEFNKPAFHATKTFLVNKGYTVLSPADTPIGLTQAQYMDISFAQIRACDIMFALPGWNTSPGAIAEVAYALKIGKMFFRRYGSNSMVTFTPNLFATVN